MKRKPESFPSPTLGQIVIIHYLVDCKRIKAKVPAKHHISGSIAITNPDAAARVGCEIGHKGVGYVCVCEPTIILGQGLHRGTGELWNVNCPDCMSSEVFLDDAEKAKDKQGHLHPKLRDILTAAGRIEGGCCG